MPDFNISIVNTNPSGSQFAKAIVDISSQSKTAKATCEDSRRKTTKSKLAVYTTVIDLAFVPATTRVVALTSSTGTLCSYTLQDLLDKSAVSHIYCLNRATAQPLPKPSNKNAVEDGTSQPLSLLARHLPHCGSLPPHIRFS
ncbi:hypothetical protein BJ878DRAFT_227832 [Calycina marina]|uniref:Uncharacterized protein n=1 Tax=Calycina marina TaxID=1763456 RepID=A0A9P8CBZ3_9HELO|nr:hypothetical protein BJ878DRAFT_227832 [Calycina marina]